MGNIQWAKGYNSVSRHVVCVGGGKNKDTRTLDQIEALEKYVKHKNHPQIKVIGHNQVSSKYCPSFDVEAWLRGICVTEKTSVYEEIHLHSLDMFFCWVCSKKDKNTIQGTSCKRRISIFKDRIISKPILLK